jgi:uncharacterized protein YjeT (DUF2065 family)
MAELAFGGLFVLQLMGLSCLALGQNAHWRRVLGPLRRPAKRRLRLIGRGSLLLSLLLAWASQGPAFGSLIWLLLLPPNGFALVFTLAWRPEWLRPLGKALSR